MMQQNWYYHKTSIGYSPAEMVGTATPLFLSVILALWLISKT